MQTLRSGTRSRSQSAHWLGALLSITLPVFAVVCSQLNVERRNIWWSKMYSSHDKEFLLSLVSWKSSWKLWHNPKLSKPELSRNVAVSWKKMLWNKERNNCMSHGLRERKSLLREGSETEDYPVKLQVNTKQTILSSLLLTKILILHHPLSYRTNPRKTLPPLTFSQCNQTQPPSGWNSSRCQCYFCYFELRQSEVHVNFKKFLSTQKCIFQKCN